MAQSSTSSYEYAFECEMDRRALLSQKRFEISTKTPPQHTFNNKCSIHDPAMRYFTEIIASLQQYLPFNLILCILSTYIIGVPIEDFYRSSSILHQALYPFSHWKNKDMSTDRAFLIQDKEILQSSQYYVDPSHHYILRTGKSVWGDQVNPYGLQDLLSYARNNYHEHLEITDLYIWKKIQHTNLLDRLQFEQKQYGNDVQKRRSSSEDEDLHMNRLEQGLKALVNLRRINMWFDYFETGLSSIVELTLSNITYIDMAKYTRDILNLKNLQKLSFVGMVISEEYFQPLVHLKKLQTLVISHCRTYKDDCKLDFTPLHSTTIKILRMERNRLDYNFYRDIIGIPNLRILSLDNLMGPEYAILPRNIANDGRFGALVLPEKLKVYTWYWAALGMHQKQGRYFILDTRSRSAHYYAVLGVHRLCRVDRFILDKKDKIFLNISTENCSFSTAYGKDDETKSKNSAKLKRAYDDAFF